jgi:hypothetical protein
VNHFVLELCSVGGFPLEEASELFSQDNKGIIFGSIVSLCLLFFLSANYFDNNCIFALHISFWYLTSGIRALSSTEILEKKNFRLETCIVDIFKAQ